MASTASHRPRLALVRGRLSAFDPHDNGITAARLVLATVVLASHSVSLGRFGTEPLITQTGVVSLGFCAVIGFFAISGFLLAGSRARSSPAVFLRNRALRILPGYWVALLFGALIAAPLGAALIGSTIEPDAVQRYLAANVGLLFTGGVLSIPPAFGGVAINGALWTLQPEVFGYLVLAFVPARRLPQIAPVELGLLFVLWLVDPLSRGLEVVLLMAFTFGIVAWSWRAWIPMSAASLAVGLGTSAISLIWLGWFPVAAIAIGYTTLGLAWLPIRLTRDLSYGVYIFAYPIQLVLVAEGVPAFGLGPMIGATILFVLPFAFASWTFIERPALSLRRARRPSWLRQPGPTTDGLGVASARAGDT